MYEFEFKRPLLQRFQLLARPSRSSANAATLVTATADEIEEDVRRNIERVINTRAPILWDYFLREQAKLVDGALLNYGMNDFCLISEKQEESERDFASALSLTINRYEPRLVVEALDVRYGFNRTILILIEGSLRMAQALSWQFECQLDVESLEVSVTPLR